MVISSGCAGPDVHRQLTQPSAHPAGKPNRNLAQGSAEVLSVQLAGAGSTSRCSRTRSPGRALLAGTWPRPRRRVILDRERQELSLRRPPQHPRDSRIEEPYDRLQHLVRCVGVASMNAEDPPAETEHHRAVGMGDDPIDISEPELQPKAESSSRSRLPLLRLLRAGPLPRCPAFTVLGPRPRSTPRPWVGPVAQTSRCRREGTGGRPTPSGSAGCAPPERRSGPG